jgi:hypothetical protein
MPMIRFLMTSIFLLMAAASATAAPTCKSWDGVPAGMKGYITSYIFGVDPQDRTNSRGAALGSALALIQQDRANMHRFNAGGYLDEWDGYFTELDRRSRISNADLRTWCDGSVGDIERIMLDARFQNHYIVDVFAEGSRLVLFVTVLAG